MYSHQIEKVESDPKHPLDIRTQLEELDINQYDLIITHGKDGDYGHVHHKSVHQVVLSLAKKVVIGTSYNGTYEINLPPHIYRKKMEALKNYKTNSCKIDGRAVEKWEALLYVYPILKKRQERFEIYYKDNYEI